MRFRFLVVLICSLVCLQTSRSQDFLPPPQEVQPVEEIPLPSVLPPQGMPHTGEFPPPIVADPLPLEADCQGCGRTVEQLKIHLVEEQEATTMHKLEVREQVVDVTTKDELKIDFYEERRTVTDLKLVPYHEVQEVVTTKLVEKPCFEINGQVIKKFVTVPCVQKVKLTKYHQVPVTREVIVTVPCLKYVPKQMLVKRMCAFPLEVAAIRTTLRGVPMHNTIHVPCCPPSFVHNITPIPVPLVEPVPMELPVEPTPTEKPTTLPE